MLDTMRLKAKSGKGCMLMEKSNACCALIYLSFDEDNYIFCNNWELDIDVPSHGLFYVVYLL